MSDVWVALAASHGIELATPGEPGADLALAGHGFTRTDFDLKIVTVLHPSRVPALVDDRPRIPLLVVAHSATPAAREAAARARVSLLVTSDRGPVRGTLLDAAGRPTQIDAPMPGERPTDDTPRTPRRGPAPWGSIALVITLLADPRPRTQATLATQVGVTQARASQVLSRLDFTRRATTGDGWLVQDTEAAAAWLAATYRRPQVSARWLSLDAPVPATRAVAHALDRAEVPYAVTGQVAADEIAPWARPTRSTIWADRLIDLADAGCTTAPATDATLIVAVPDDPWALRSASLRGDLRVADGWRTWVTLLQDGDTQAADHLKERLTAR
jgi:hypothetical protein